MIIVCEKCESKFNIPDGAISQGGRTVKCSKCSHKWHQYPIDNKETQSSPIIEPKAAIADTSPELANKDKLPDPQAISTIDKNEETEDQTSTQAAQETKLSSNSTDDPVKKSINPRRFQADKIPFYQNNFVFYTSSIIAAACFVFLLTMVFAFSHYSITSKVPIAQNLYNIMGIYDTNGLELEWVDCTLSEIQSSSSDDESIEMEVEVSIANTAEVQKHLSTIRFTIYDIRRNYVGELIMDLQQNIAPGSSTNIEGRLNRVPKDSFFVAIDLGNKLDLKLIRPNRMHEIG